MQNRQAAFNIFFFNLRANMSRFGLLIGFAPTSLIGSPISSSGHSITRRCSMPRSSETVVNSV
jgi:hypothetical protein